MTATAKNKTVIILAGPTAVGKTHVAIEIARSFGTDIISADSRQCFKEMCIGVARPSPGELAAVPHHFIATHSILDDVTAVTFEKYALEKSTELFRKHEMIMMTGGTGLYIKAFSEGLDDIPDVPVNVRDLIVTNYRQGGLTWLREEIKEKDPAFYKEGETQNPQRMMRALEVMAATGNSIVQFQKGVKKSRPFNILKIGLELPKGELQERINHRVDKMIEAGLVDEVRSLAQYRHLNALQTVGYIEIIDFLDKKTTLQVAIEKIKMHTRQYAKRQMTWFKRDKDIRWFSPGEINLIFSTIKENLPR
jgi:tRNA dimethylallyltransferase